MPTYEYECAACGNRIDAFHSMSDPPLKKCPKCGKRRLKRLIGAGAGVIFKGTGFYTTDYRSSSYESSKKSDSESPAKSETKTDTKSETKSETSPKPDIPSPTPAVKKASKKK
jgi:putative FmdB family regulatory protein